jgi:hypothetical protein
VTFEPGCRLSTLGESAFAGCSSLRSIFIPSSIEAISRFGFRQCENLVRIVLESGGELSAESVMDLRSKRDFPCTYPAVNRVGDAEVDEWKSDDDSHSLSDGEELELND